MARTDSTTSTAGSTTPRRTAREQEPAASALPSDKAGRARVVIGNVQPEIDCGRHPVKRVVGECVVVEADIFAAGHELVACWLLHRREGSAGGGGWIETPMHLLVNDRWQASFHVSDPGRYAYTIIGCVDRFGTWRRDLRKRLAGGVDVSVDMLIGAEIVELAHGRASGELAQRLARWATALRDESLSIEERLRIALANEDFVEVMERTPDRRFATRYDRVLSVVVDPPKARFSTWYEVFPRSCALERGQHGTFRDVIKRLPHIAGMGFDVLYLPPIHPIGRTHRKGCNNAARCEPGDVGSPWAIGGEEGGHKAIHAELGTLDDFRDLVRAAEEHGMSVALDIAFQCSPDHPYVAQHPEWFRKRPDGTIQYAENPPKKYQDIFPLEFDTDAWESLWAELKSVFTHWIQQGVTIFRVDNPHTKPFAFWEWCIGEIKRDHPEVIFLSEAFTRPKVMYELAKLGFTQSYTYFTWRNERWELIEYFSELTGEPEFQLPGVTISGMETAATPVREFFRPNVWPNTPDILHEYLQEGGRPAFMIRLILAATLAANYGMYGPAFELCEHAPREPGSEEYLNSEKYEIRWWEWDRPDSLRPLIARVNAIRRENSALQHDWSLRFHTVDNERIICYSKAVGSRLSALGSRQVQVEPTAGSRRPTALSNLIITIVNLDPFRTQSGWVELPLDEFGLAEDQPFIVHDLLTDARYTWQGRWNYVELNPFAMPAHILRVETEGSPARRAGSHIT
jgi:starch synthase (maltosyl-transferring)